MSIPLTVPPFVTETLAAEYQRLMSFGDPGEPVKVEITTAHGVLLCWAALSAIYTNPKQPKLSIELGKITRALLDQLDVSESARDALLAAHIALGL